MTEVELQREYAGLAPGTRLFVVRHHQHSPMLTVSPSWDRFRAFLVPIALVREVA